jgi:hypothetical protein
MHCFARWFAGNIRAIKVLQDGKQIIVLLSNRQRETGRHAKHLGGGCTSVRSNTALRTTFSTRSLKAVSRRFHHSQTTWPCETAATVRRAPVCPGAGQRFDFATGEYPT